MAWRGEVEDGSGWGGLVASKSELREEARLAALERDAARYRWLVNSGKYAPAMYGGGWGLRIGAGSKSTKAELDEAIDAAMQGANTWRCWLE